MQQFVVIGVAAVVVVVLAPLLFACAGWLHSRRTDAATQAGVRADWRLIADSALLYALAFNLVFFVQELFLVVPKALTPGLRPTTRGGHYAVERAVRAQFGPGFRQFGALRRRRNELEYPERPGDDATQDEAAEAVDSAEAIITASQGLLDQLGLF